MKRRHRRSATLPDTKIDKYHAMRAFHANLRTRMLHARHAMNEGHWRQAATELERLIRDSRARRVGHAEALWALAVCRESLGDTAGALEALDASIAMDPTGLTPHETREALIRQLQERAADRQRPRGSRNSVLGREDLQVLDILLGR